MKMIQVFTKSGEGQAEVNAELLRLKYLQYGVWIKSREGDSVQENFFPYATLDFVRLWDEKSED